MSSSFNIESSIVTFSGTDSVTYNFTQGYLNPPIVTATINVDNVNIYIESVTINSVVIKSSQPGNFTANIQVISRRI